ncbi:MAG: autotransporter domain-containing protein [Erythrobacter sp.]
MPLKTSALASDLGKAQRKNRLSRLFNGASVSCLAWAGLLAAPASAQIAIVDDTPVDNPGPDGVTSADGVTQTVNSGDNIRLENQSSDGAVITLGGTHINNDGDDEDVVIEIDNSEDDITVNVLSTGVLQGFDGVIFFEGDNQILNNAGLIEGTGEATEAVVYFDRDADGLVNTIINSGTITSVGGATIGVDSLLGDDPSSGTVGDEEGIARFRLVNTGTISNTGTDSDADALHFNGDPGSTGGEDRGCLEGAQVNCVIEVDITNSGTISANRNNASNAAIRSESDAVLRGTIVNEAGGMITAAANAIRINGAHADHSVTITNAGTINGQAEAGILIGGTGVAVVNEAGGMIIGDDEGIRIDGDSISIRILGGSDVAADTVPENTVITNSGTISGTADGILTASDTLGATITNNATGSITGEEGIDLATGGTVTNNGSIFGSVGDAINIEGTQDATVTLGAGSSTNGTDDAVQFAGTGTNTLTVNSGASINGDLQASTEAGATNILNLVGSDTTLNFIRAFDFGEVNVDGGVFSLSSFATGNGDININSGTLLINSGGTTGLVTVAAGGVLGGNGSAGDTVVEAGGIINPGNLGDADVLNLNSLVLSNGSILAFDLGDPNDPNSSDRINVGGDLTLDGTINTTDVGQFGTGVYRLIDYGGSLTDNGLDVGTLPMGFTPDQAVIQTSVGGQINLVISPAAPIGDIQFFDGVDIAQDGTVDGGSGVWDLTTLNWTSVDGGQNNAWNDLFAIFQGAAGTVTVNGDVTFTGLQFVTDGYVLNDGTGSLTITEETTNVRVDAGNTATINSAIGGTGGISQLDTGTLILAGDNTFTGGIVVDSGGTLQLDGSLVSSAAINNGSTLTGTGAADNVTIFNGATIAPGEDGTAGVLTTGDLFLFGEAILEYDLGAPDDLAASDRIQVNGNLTLDGTVNANDLGGFGLGVYRLIDYTGALTDNGLDVGTLPTGFDASQGTIQTTVDGQVNLIIDLAIPEIQFWDGSDATGDNTIDGGSGSWNLTDTNWTGATGEFNAAWNENFAVFAGASGTVTVDDAITFTGLQFVTDGYEIASGTGALTITEAATAVRVDPGVTATISAPIGGTGGIQKLDSGTLILAGDHTYTGDTIVDGGILDVAGTIASVVTVNAGASLVGIGTTGGINVTGTISPGNSIGVLNVAGDVNFAAGSFYDVEIDPDGSSDMILATGAVTIDGGTVNVLASSTNFNVSTDYTIITADGGVTGTFDTVTSNLAFLTPELSYDANNVFLNVTRNDVEFSDIAQTANQAAVGGALEVQGNANVVNAIINLDEATALDSFEQLSGELHPTLRSAMLEENRLVRNALAGHLFESAGESSIWGEAWGFSGDSDSDGNAVGASRDGFGFLVGADVAVGEGASLGIAVNYNQSDIELDGTTLNPSLGDGSTDSFGISGYFGVEAGGLNLRTGGGFSWSDIETSRSVTFGTFADTLTATYDGSVLFGFVEAGYPIAMGSGKIEPYVGLAFTEVETRDFNEIGGDAALRFEEAIENSSIGQLGVRFATSQTSTFRILGNAGYQVTFNELEPASEAAFGLGSRFTVAGAPQSRNAGFLQLEGSFGLSENASIGLSYDGIYGDNSQDHAGVVRLRIGF